jgi:hypothetical protein
MSAMLYSRYYNFLSDEIRGPCFEKKWFVVVPQSASSSVVIRGSE